MKYKKLLVVLVGFILSLSNCKPIIPLQNERGKYNIVQESKGDLNLDGINDVAVIISKSNSNKGTVVIYILDSNENIKRKLINESLTDDFVNMFDTLPDIEIANGELVLSYYGGMCHREGRNVVFQFNKGLNELFFKVISGGEHNVCNDEEPTSYEVTSPELRKTNFTNYKGKL